MLKIIFIILSVLATIALFILAIYLYKYEKQNGLDYLNEGKKLL